MTIEVRIPRDERGGIRHAAGYMRNGSHFKPQRASVRAGRSGNVCESGRHASALRLKIPNVNAIWLYAGGYNLLSRESVKISRDKLGVIEIDRLEAPGVKTPCGA